MKAGWTISAALARGRCSRGALSRSPTTTAEPPPTGIPVHVDIISADRLLADHERHQDRAEGRGAEAAGREGRRGEAGRGSRTPRSPRTSPRSLPTAERIEPPKPPEPEKKKAEPKPPVPQPQAKPEPKQAFAKEPEQKIDPIAEALKKDNAKKPEPKTAGSKTEVPSRRRRRSAEPKQQPKFDADASRRCSTSARRSAKPRPATRSSNTPSLGTRPAPPRRCRRANSTRCARGSAQCWNVPVGVAEARDLVVTVRIQFKQDGTLSAEPRLMNTGSASGVPCRGRKRAARGTRCAPYSFLPVPNTRPGRTSSVDFRSARHVPRLMRPPDLRGCTMIAMTTTLRSASGSRAGAVLALGAAASAGAPARGLPRPFAQTRLDVTQGNVAADADRASRISSAARRPMREVARGVTQVITANLRRSGLFAPIDPAAFIEKITNFDAPPRFPDWQAINAQALVTGRVDAPGRRAAQGRVPAVGRVRRPAARRPAIFHHARTTGAASRTSSRTRSTSA